MSRGLAEALGTNALIKDGRRGSSRKRQDHAAETDNTRMKKARTNKASMSKSDSGHSVEIEGLERVLDMTQATDRRTKDVLGTLGHCMAVLAEIEDPRIDELMELILDSQTNMLKLQPN